MSVYRAGRPGSWGSDMDAGEETARKWEAHYEAMEALYRSFSERTQGRYEEACADALRRLRFHTDLKTGRFEAVLDPKNSTWLGELPAKERRLLKLRAKAPGLYGALRRVYGLLQQQGRGV